MSLSYYVLDTETTGLKVGYHEITQISIIRCSDRHQLSKYIRAEYPKRANPVSLEITGRTIKDIMQGISKEDAVRACTKFFNEDGQTPEHRCIVAHNATFDRKFCHELWKQCKVEFPAVCWLDTMPATREFLKFNHGIAKPKVGLKDAVAQLGIKFRGTAHNAIGDTQSTYMLREHLIKEGFDFLQHIKRFPLESSSDSDDSSDDDLGD